MSHASELRSDVPAGEWFAGETKLLAWTIRNAQGGLQDMSGPPAWTLRLDVKDSEGTVLVTKTVGAGLTIAAVGRIEGTIAAGEVGASARGKPHQITLWRTDAGGEHVLSWGSAPVLAR